MNSDEFQEWIDGLAGGKAQAAQALWEQYYSRLLRLADRQLGGSRRAVVGPEDVVQSALGSFFRGFQAGRFPRLDDELDLWKILVTITARKAIAELRRQTRRASAGESSLRSMGGIGEVLGSEPTPEVAAIAIAAFERLLDVLPDETLRKVALMKCELYTRDEIARELGCSESTVKRACERIRQKWLEAGEHER